MGYSPEDHLEHRHPDVTVHRCCLPHALAAWFPARRLMLVSDALDAATRRCVLAHEVEHIHEDSSHCEDGTLAARQELRVDRAAARRLIGLDDLIRAVFLHGDAVGMAEELGVTPHVICVRVADLTADERDYVDAQLWAREESA